MSTVAVELGSWLNLKDLYTYSGTEFWGLIDYPDIPYSSNDSYIQITRQYFNRLDLLAFDVYGNEQLWWVILLANQLKNGDPVMLPNHFVVGDIVRVPDINTINKILAQGSEGQAVI